MAQTLNIPIFLGSSKTGLTLRAQLFDDDGADVGSPVTTGFSERDGGVYFWHYEGFPDDFSGGVDFFDNDTDEYQSSTALNAADFGAGGSGDDPLLAAVPGSYASGTAGAALGKIGVGTISVTNALTPGGDLYLFVGDSYLAANGKAQDFTDTEGNWPVLTGLEIHFYLQELDVEAEVIVATGANKKIRVELTSAQTATLIAKKSQYALKIFYEGVDPDPDEFVTITEGRSIVKVAP